jgi:broad specificity phosphatase PhoE
VTVRLTLVSHGMTDAMAAGRFPADEPLTHNGHRQVGRFEIPSNARQVAGPELRARQTADLLGLRAAIEPRLAELDCASWRGKTLRSIPADDLQAWLTDPARAPHGGESIACLIDRVAGWLKSLSDDTVPTVAVTHPAVIRAAILVTLDAPPKSFWRIDIASGGRTVLHFRDERWTLRSSSSGS